MRDEELERLRRKYARMVSGKGQVKTNTVYALLLDIIRRERRGA